MSNILKLQNWFRSQCDDNWEHQFGIRIETLDNPGWKLEIDLCGTSLESKGFVDVKRNYESDDTWLTCKVSDGKFIAFCGPLLVDEAIGVFSDWCDGT